MEDDDIIDEEEEEEEEVEEGDAPKEFEDDNNGFNIGAKEVPDSISPEDIGLAISEEKQNQSHGDKLSKPNRPEELKKDEPKGESL